MCRVLGRLNPLHCRQQARKRTFSTEEIAELMQKFIKTYPSAIVGTDAMPSSLFLALVREHLHSKRLSWIPWRLRSSALDEVNFLWQRHHRTDVKLLTRLLQEGHPAEECIASVPQSGPVELIVRQSWDPLRYAIALYDGAYLPHLWKTAEKFLSIALAVPSARNMRPPSVQEIAEADRALWVDVASTQADQGWSLTDALAEIIFACPAVYTSLEPRLKPATPPTPPPVSGANVQKRPALPPPPQHKQPRPAKATAKATSEKVVAPKVSLKSGPFMCSHS